MPDARARAGQVGQRPPQAFGDHHRAMSAARTPDANGQIAFALGDIVWQYVAQVAFEPFDELLSGGVLLHERRHGPVAARPPAQCRYEMRIRETPDVEHQVGIDGYAVLVPETE